MKTIAQIAAEIGVSKQAVQKRIAREPLYTCISPCLYTEKGTKYIDENGEELIKSAFNKSKPTTTSIDMSMDESNVSIDIADNQKENVYSDVYSDVHSDIIKILQENITVLQEQLKIKDKQIEDLTTTVKTQAESINFDRKNELAETFVDGQALLMGGELPPKQGEEKEKKKGFLQRLFNK